MTRIIELIWDESGKRGMGVEGDPVRAITRLWTKDGKLVAEHDPMEIASNFFNPETIN